MVTNLKYCNHHIIECFSSFYTEHYHEHHLELIQKRGKLHKNMMDKYSSVSINHIKHTKTTIKGCAGKQNANETAGSLSVPAKSQNIM